MKQRSFRDDARRALLGLKDCKVHLLRLLDAVEKMPESTERATLVETLEQARSFMISSAENIVVSARKFDDLVD